ncbi:MAG: hypothetical protein V3S69_06655, partial [Dehalococcoidales bacterium]
MTDYTRQSIFTSGDVIKAEHGNAEFDQVAAFAAQATGHAHAGASGEGAYVPLISDTTNTDKVEIVTGGAKTTGTHQVTGALAADAGATVTGNIVVTGTVDGRDVAADGIVLDAIGAGTGVTAANIINVPAGAVAAVEVQAAINELDTEKVAIAGDTMTGDLTVPNLITAGNVDGRDVSVDGTKLDTIETSATADQSPAEIKTGYEINVDTNAFDDAALNKLAGIETSAKDDQIASEVISSATGAIVATNVQAAIAELEAEKAALSGAAFTGAILTTSTIDGRDVNADGVKLDSLTTGNVNASVRTKAAFFADMEKNKDSYAGSGFIEWGKHSDSGSE